MATYGGSRCGRLRQNGIPQLRNGRMDDVNVIITFSCARWPLCSERRHPWAREQGGGQRVSCLSNLETEGAASPQLWRENAFEKCLKVFYLAQGWRNRETERPVSLGQTNVNSWAGRGGRTRCVNKIVPFRKMAGRIRWLFRFRTGSPSAPWNFGTMEIRFLYGFSKQFIFLNWTLFEKQ